MDLSNFADSVEYRFGQCFDNEYIVTTLDIFSSNRLWVFELHPQRPLNLTVVVKTITIPTLQNGSLLPIVSIRRIMYPIRTC